MAEGETIGESGQALERPRGSLLNHPVGQREQPVGNASAEAFTVSAYREHELACGDAVTPALRRNWAAS